MTALSVHQFDNAIIDAMTKPPRADGDPNGFYAHTYLGRHQTFHGRPYRRGKNRCHFCGAFLIADDGPPDPDRHLSMRDRMVKIIYAPSPLLKWLREKANHGAA